MNKSTNNTNLELTILMPCLDEAETLAICIRKAQRFLTSRSISGEILIADNGSTDGSQSIAESEHARVIHVKQKGYGSALLAGIKAARGKYVIMGDADDSYDFSKLDAFVDRLRDGADVVMGNRFQGGIEKGAMPFLHRYLGNPVLSFLGRAFFKIKIGDFHCGLRGFKRDAILELELQTSGMEFASELVVKSALAKLRIDEVPTTLSVDGRSRPPHLRTWRDGWRHLVFLLLYSPKWLFLYPGIALMLFGLVSAFALFPGTVQIGNTEFDIHTFLVGCLSIIVGLQAICFAVLARKFATNFGLLPPIARYTSFFDALKLESILIAALIIITLGAIGFIWCIANWALTGFGPLEYSSLLRVLVLSMTSIAIGVQLTLNGFLYAVTEIPIVRLHNLNSSTEQPIANKESTIQTIETVSTPLPLRTLK